MANEKNISAKELNLEKKALKHIAFIMDGNGRWAQKRGLPRKAGHVQGAKKFKEVIKYCGDIGIEYVTVYAFSTENWGRPEDEVNAIMKLLDSYLDECERSMDEYDIRLRFIGDMSVFSDDFNRRREAVEKRSEKNTRSLNIALNYGGRDELVHAYNRLMSEGKTNITAEDISGALYTAGQPDPDLIVRTAGEMRISNFLLWQCAYSEFYYTDTLWPDMSPDDIDRAVLEFYNRKRRFGKL